MMPQALFLGQSGSGSADNPVTLSDVPTEASPQDPGQEHLGAEDEAKILSHYCDTLDEMVQSIADLEGRYFLVLWEMIHETRKALPDV